MGARDGELDLAPQIEAVARRLLGEPNKRMSMQRQLRFGSRGALAVEIGGTKRGCWFDHSEGNGGGVLDLVVRKRGGTRAEALAWLREQQLFSSASASPALSNDETEHKEWWHGDSAPLVQASLASWACRLWQSCRPITPADVAGRYLQARGCMLPPPCSDLKWLPCLPHPCGHEGPALVGLVTAVANAERQLNLHKTWITTNGSGRKAFDHLPADERPQARLVLWKHTTTNGCARLWPDSDVDTRLTVGEGVETCLAAARTHWPAWSLLNAGNLKAMPLLAGIEALTIVCDHDPAGVVAALEAGARWRAAGREVAVLYPTKRKTDWTDVVGAGEATGS